MIRLSTALLPLCLLGCPKQTIQPAPEASATSSEVRKGPNDSREYRTLKLDNGMKVLLIRDTETDMAAAALDVHIGQFADPVDRQGLTHFLEHMLFMGTEKYPDVDAYRKFITDHGGGTNAGTGTEHTTYHFDIDQEYLEPALDRFAQFFVAPKLDPEYVDRERNAVHSEYSLKIKDEARRNREVMRATSNPDHPFAKFSVGNLDTLSDSEENPLWDDLKAQYDGEYNANRMAVGVIGREDLDTLEQWVRGRFSPVKTGEPAETTTLPILTADQLGVRVNITPLADRRVLELHFPGPPSHEHFRERPVSAIANLLGHEGEGSLFSLLKNKGWVDGLGASGDRADDHTMTKIRIALTEEGYGHIDEIADLCFQTIRLIQRDGLEEWRHQELEQISALNFRFSDVSSPTSAARSARQLQTYPAEHVLDWWATSGDFDADLLQTYLDTMRPENMRLVVIGPDLETDQTEPLYQVPYGSTPLDPALIEQWMASEIDPALVLPEKNPFIPQDVELKEAAGDKGRPERIVETEGLSVWHHQDVSFDVPDAFVKIELLAPAPSMGVRSRVKNTLLSMLIDDSFQEFAYMPRLAGLYFDVGASSRGFTLRVSGYADKQPQIIERLTERVASFTVDPERFGIVRDKLVEDWRNTTKARPMSQANWELGELLDPLDFDYLDGADALDELTAEELQEWADTFLQGATAQILVHGNSTAAQATEIGERIAAEFVADDKADRPVVEVRKIPQTGELVRDVAIDHDDSVFLALYQGRETSLQEQARYRMLAQVLKTPFFTELRTNQQLGYSCRASFDRTDTVPGLRLSIQSSSAGPVVLQERIDAFVADYLATLQGMSDEEYSTIRAGLIADIEKKELRLSTRNRRYQGEISRGHLDFDSRERLVTAIETVDRQALVDFYSERLLADDAGRMIVRSFGHLHGEDDAFEPGCEDSECITDQMPERFGRTY